jgi:hypothetical protein
MARSLRIFNRLLYPFLPMKTARIASVVVFLLIGSVFQTVAMPKVVAQDSKQSDEAVPRPTGDDPRSVGPIGVFAEIEEGWKNETVEKILQHFGKGKVGISIAGLGPAGGAFSKNQSHYLFKDLFKYTITEKFEFVQYRNVSDGRVKVYAVAERSYKRNDDGRLFEDKIYVSLELEDDRWVIGEIKSIR